MPRATLPGTMLTTAYGLDSATSTGTALTSHATPGTDGAWTEIVSSTGHACDELEVSAQATGTVTANSLLQVGVGAAASEVALGPLIHLCQPASTDVPRSPVRLRFGRSIAAGSRIAARLYRSTGVSATARCSVAIHRFGGQPGRTAGIWTSYGIDTGNATGTTVDPGGTNNTEGTKTAIVTGTSGPIRVLWVVTNHQNLATWTTNDFNALVRIYRKISSTYYQIVPTLYTVGSQTLDSQLQIVHGPFYINQPANIDISASVQASANSASIRTLAISLIAGY